MSKKNKVKTATTNTAKEQTAKQEAKKKPVPTPPKTETKEEKKEEEVQTAEVVVMQKQEDTPTAKFLKSVLEDSKKSDGLSPDSTVTLANLIQRRYVENKAETVTKFGQPFLDGMNTVADALIVTTVIQQVVSTNTPFALLIKNSAYPQIQSLAKTFDIELPPIDKLALPALPGKKSNGTQLELEFKPDMIPDNTKKRVLCEAAKATETAPELDPTKMTSDEDVTKALAYILSKRDDAKNGIAKNLLEAIKLVKDYRYHQLETAEPEKKEEAKKALDERAIDDWMVDMATFSEPTLIYETLGFAMVKTVVNEKCPMGAFLDARHIFTSKGQCAFTDAEIAAIVKLLVRWYCTYASAKNYDIINKKKTTESAKKQAQSEIDRCNAALHYMTDFDSSIVDEVKNVFTAESTSISKKLYYFTRGQYYGSDISGHKNPEGEFINLTDNVCQRIGIISNLFRSVVDQNDDYSEANIQDLIKRPEENAPETKTDGESGEKETSTETKTEETEPKK